MIVVITTYCILVKNQQNIVN